MVFPAAADHHRAMRPAPSAARLLALLLVVPAISTTIAAPAGAAVGPCAKWAATSGNNANAGTQAAPYRTLGKLVSSLAPGEVGCLPAGQTFSSAYAADDQGYAIVNSGGGSAEAPIVITSGPGGTATFEGQLYLGPDTHDITLTGLAFAGKEYANGVEYGYKGVHLQLHGDRIRVEDNDITDRTGICLQLGNSNQPDPADDVVVTRNRIHGCGMDPDITWVDADSGAHGIYVQNTRRAVITENLIYGNRTRGVQLYPRNDGTEVHHNLFWRNATQVNIGSEGPDAAYRSDVHHNLMADRVTNWAPAKNEAQVFGNMPQAGDFDNVVRANCYDPEDVFTAGYGMTVAGDNVAGVPAFADAAEGDFTLTPGSDCVGFGPASIQPPTTPFELPDRTATEGTGEDVIMTFSWSRLVHAEATLEPGTAGAADYELLDSHLGDLMEQSARVRVVGDAVDEPTETFTFVLTDYDNGEELGRATGTIVDDDPDVPPPGAPDALVRVAGGTYVGDGVQNTSGADQTASATVPQGRSVRFDLLLQNDAAGADDLLAAAAPSTGHPGLVHRWTRDGSDVSADVDGGNLLMTDVPAGASRPLSLTVTPGASAAVGSTFTWYLHLYRAPIGATPVKDVVALRVTVAPAVRRPDAAVGPAGGRLVGRGIVGSSARQRVTGRIAPGRSASYRVLVVNDGSLPRALSLRATGPQGDVAGRWLLGSRDVTRQVRGGTLRTAVLAPGRSVELRLVLSVSRRARSGSAATTGLVVADGSARDTVQVRTVVR